MKKLFTVLALTLVGCAPETEAPCGVTSVSPDLSDETVMQVVIRTLTEVAKTRDTRLHGEAACVALNGYSVRTHPDTFTRTHEGKKVAVRGFTACGPRTIEITPPRDGRGFEYSSLAHEFIHAMTDCVNRKGDADDWQYPDHEGWKHDGLFDAVDRVLEAP